MWIFSVKKSLCLVETKGELQLAGGNESAIVLETCGLGNYMCMLPVDNLVGRLGRTWEASLPRTQIMDEIISYSRASALGQRLPAANRELEREISACSDKHRD